MRKTIEHVLYTICIQDDEFNEILRSSKRIEFLYDHWFDETIVNDDFKMALEQLLEADHKLKTEPLWAPAAWLL